ncbi:VacJ family lipoprotein [Myxococcota bacterium]|nr:VacJ family lipoprotein [Myxococcota bacterium]
MTSNDIFKFFKVLGMGDRTRGRLSSKVLLIIACAILCGQPSWGGAREGFNSANRSFNFWLLDHLFEPVARGYNFIMPKWGQAGVRNALENLARPRDAVQSLLQGKVRRAGSHLGALLIDSTLGIGGLTRPSERWLALESPETMNETLGVYGIPEGPYLVLPLLGETCPRCLIGRAVDTALYPIGLLDGVPHGVETPIEAVNFLARQMPKPGAPKEDWDRYEKILKERPTDEEAERLFHENLAADVAD